VVELVDTGDFAGRRKTTPYNVYQCFFRHNKVKKALLWKNSVNTVVVNQLDIR